MEELSDILISVMSKLKKYDEECYDKYKKDIYEMAYGKVLTKDIAEKAVADMKPDGEHWSIEQTTSVKKQYGYEEIDDVEFYAVMNMAWNDYKDLFKDDLEMYAKFSKAFISDIDAKKDKVYDSIVK